ncbi:hypothetical protein QLR68_32840, partial [Micromonospora sp. DH15]|nr:hypothetical protein [Micromonospora sp. DH15]
SAFHRGEVDRVRDLAGDGADAWTLAPRMPWRKPWDDLGRGTRRFSLMHTLALLRHVTGANR